MAVKDYERLSQIPADTAYSQKSDLAQRLFLKTLAEAQADLLDPEQHETALNYLMSRQHDLKYQKVSVLQENKHWMDRHELRLAPEIMPSIAKSYMQAAKDLSRHQEYHGLEEKNDAVLSLMEASLDAAAGSQNGHRRADNPWQVIKDTSLDFIQHTIGRVIDTNSRRALQSIEYYNHTFGDHLFDPEQTSQMLLDKSYRIIAEQGRDKDGNDPQIARDLQANRLTKELDRIDRKKAMPYNDSRSYRDFEVLNQLTNHAIILSQETLTAKDMDPAELKRQRREKNGQHDHANQIVIDNFNDLKDNIKPKDQLLFWMRIHSQARSGSKIHREATRQMKTVFDSVTPEQAIEFSFNGGMRSVFNHHNGLPGAYNANGSNFKLKDTTLLLAAQMALNHMPEHHVTLQTSHRNVTQTVSDVAARLALPKTSEESIDLRNQATAAAQAKKLNENAQNESIHAYSDIFSIFTAKSKNKRQAATLANKLILQYADSYAAKEPHLSRIPQSDVINPSYLIDFVKKSTDQGIKIPLATIQRVDELTRTDRSFLSNRNNDYDRYNTYFVEQYEKEALKTTHTKAKRASLWTAYKDNLENVSSVPAKLALIAESSQRIADKLDVASLASIKRRKDDILPVLTANIRSIVNANDESAGHGIGPFYGMHNKRQNLEEVAQTTGVLYPEVAKLAHAAQAEILGGSSENNVPLLEERLQNTKSYMQRDGYSSNGIRATRWSALSGP